MEHINIPDTKPVFSLLSIDDAEELTSYLQNLGDDSRSRFGPHPFSLEEVQKLLADKSLYHLFAARHKEKGKIIAYAILKRGWLDFEYHRLQSYGLHPEEGDYTLAPSVADAWQGKGLGSFFMSFLINYAKQIMGAKRFVLWGGVQSHNPPAVKLYNKHGFRVLGQFEHHGQNFDMILEL